MHDFSVDPLALEVSAAELRTESARIGAILAGLEQEVGRLEASWDGDARSAYQRAQRSWSATFSEMRDLLERIARKVRMQRLCVRLAEAQRHKHVVVPRLTFCIFFRLQL